jgi:murein L,D-transpeptidase YcbB/YkuD
LKSAALLLVLATAMPAAAQTPSETLRARVEQVHEAPAALRGVRLLQADAVAHFFEARAFEPAWDVPGDSEQIREAIADADEDGLTPSDYHLAEIDRLLEARRRAPSPALDADLQLLLSDAVAGLVDHLRYGRVRPIALDRRWNVDPRAGAPPLESVLAQIASARSTADALEALKPTHFIYTGLKQALARYRAAAAGGWPVVAAGPTIKPGATDDRIGAIRARLLASGDLSGWAPSTNRVYDLELESAVRLFQERHRLTADGEIGKATVQAMNVSPAARADQIRVNLERARWVIGGLSDSFVLVNLPAFKVYLIRHGRNVWEARTQIGREARQTPTFRADLRYLVFNPDWTVPPTILATDVLGAMRKGKNAIASKHLTIYDRQGRAVDPATIDWTTAAPSTFPYTLRQLPGADNALGRVKFIFPNEHSIFLHDTPSRELFGADQRTFSSGCIRVERPLELAALLLDSQEEWTPDRIKSAIEDGKPQTVLLSEPLPVLIVYWTVTVGASGELRFARDVYGHDAALLRALGASGQSGAAGRPATIRPD